MNETKTGHKTVSLPIMHQQLKAHPIDIISQASAKLRTIGVLLCNEDGDLATDPDREGEAIAWHLQDALKLKDAKRVTLFGDHPKSHQGRTQCATLHRYGPGYRTGRTAGAGSLLRLYGQRAALQRGRGKALRRASAESGYAPRGETQATTHYGVELTFENVDNITDGWKAVWQVKPWLEDGQEYLLDKALAEKAAALRSLEVTDCKESESRSAPPAPFTTPSLQQAASNVLKFTPKQTMQLAQRLTHKGYIFLPDAIGSSVPTGLTQCEVISYGVRFRILMHFNIYPSILKISCDGYGNSGGVNGSTGNTGNMEPWP